MKIVLSFLIFLVLTSYGYAQFDFQRSWGTYLGDEHFALGDSGVDSEGNLYIVGTINGSELTGLLHFTHANFFQQFYGGGSSDGFIIKLNPNGEIVWGAFLGGENADGITAIDFDNNDNVYVLGVTTSTTNIATQGSFQEVYGGGERDVFIAKFSTIGNLQWSTYYGGELGDGTSNPYQFSSISFDGNNAIYAVFQTHSTNLATIDAFQTVPIPEDFQSNNANPNILTKFDLNGNRLWATYYGISNIFSVKANSNNVYVAGATLDCPPNGISNTYYGTSNAYMPEPASCRDIFLTRFNATGERVWSTYYGGSSNGDIVNGKRVIDLKENTIFLSGMAPNYDNQEIATDGTYQPTSNGSSHFIAQFNDDSTRNWGTYNGLNSDNSASFGRMTNVLSGQGENTSFYNYGVTADFDNISTSDGYQATKNNGSKDFYVSKFRNSVGKLWGRIMAES